MIEWGRVPWTLWVLAATWVVGTVLIEIQVHGPVAPRVIFPIVMLVWLYLFLRGMRWVWIATLAVSILGLVPDLISGSLTWQGAAGGLATVVLLLLPATRHYVADRPATAEA